MGLETLLGFGKLSHRVACSPAAITIETFRLVPRTPRVRGALLLSTA